MLKSSPCYSTIKFSSFFSAAPELHGKSRDAGTINSIRESIQRVVARSRGGEEDPERGQRERCLHVREKGEILHAE